MKHEHPRPFHVLARLLLGLTLLLGLSILVGSFSLVAHAQPAATISVTPCDESHLDAAIASASSGDTITFGCSGDIALTQTLTISKNLTLDGSGQTVTLDGQNQVQDLSVNAGVTFTLNALTIAHGNGSLGGGLNNRGTVAISNSTFASNFASGGGGGVNNYGGIATITNSTFASNSSSYRGGGLINVFSGTVTISNSTFANNSSSYIGGGLSNYGSNGTVRLTGSIVANNPGGDCAGSQNLIDGGYNLSSDSSCGFTGTGDQQNTDPKLDPNGLQNNSGPTQTIALQSGSPAIDQIPSTSCPTKDQRGMNRPDNQEATCDIGAYEFQDDAPLTLTHFVAGPLEHHSAGVAATFTDADPNGQVSDYTATVSWGDGTTSTVKVYKNPFGKGFALAAVHRYARTGTYTLNLTIMDKGGSSISKTVTITVK